MILVISRFRVANALEGAVRQAFIDRPRRVDASVGFLGMEVFTPADDPATFFLVTRWTDEASYRVWHRGEEHKASHAFIPKGLKLDPSCTQLTVLERIEPAGEAPSLEQITADGAPILARFLAEATTVQLAAGRLDGTIVQCTRRLAERLGGSPEDIVGQPIFAFLTEPDAAWWRARLGERSRQPPQSELIGLVDRTQSPYTLQAVLDVQPTGFLLIGEEPRRKGARLVEELIELNNQLSLLTRENARRAKELTRVNQELEQAMRDLRDGHFLLRRVQELLTLCAYCGKVKDEHGRWVSVGEYLSANDLMVSHGYCDSCAERVMRELDEADEQNE